MTAGRLRLYPLAIEDYPYADVPPQVPNGSVAPRKYRIVVTAATGMTLGTWRCDSRVYSGIYLTLRLMVRRLNRSRPYSFTGDLSISLHHAVIMRRQYPPVRLQ